MPVFAQAPRAGSGPIGGYQRTKASGDTILPIDTALAPFYHGVASGDPTSSAVIIWTRITPDSTMMGSVVPVNYEVATDTLFTTGAGGSRITSGVFQATPGKDYTVKVDITGLAANTTYYYRFSTNSGEQSIIGRTKTLAASGESHIKLAVVSCQNYEAGYFNAYENISRIEDLDAVVHLGDYIYEYQVDYYGDQSLLRKNVPSTEITSLSDYRTRYSLYRLDKALMRAHQQHPFITIWDDHESANDAWKEGAENHDSTEGPWINRKNISKQVYYEWMPIRETTDTIIYRKFDFGGLAELIMLDTRLEGRDQQPATMQDPSFFAPRTLLGSQQKTWMLDNLKNSTARWKIIGNQVIFSELNVGFADTTGNPFNAEDIFLDIWDGYPLERQEILDTIDSAGIENLVFLTGDFHSTFAFEVTKPTVAPPTPFIPDTNAAGYSPSTGAGAYGVEFATPSIASANFDENVSLVAALTFQAAINNPIPVPGFGNVNFNPHMKYTDLINHGYFVLDVKTDSIQADYYFVDRIDTVDATQNHANGLRVMFDSTLITTGFAPAVGKINPPMLAPWPAGVDSNAVPNNAQQVFQQPILLGLYPNPALDYANLQYALNVGGFVQVRVVDATGKTIEEVFSGHQPSGVFNFTLETGSYREGIYFIQIMGEKALQTAKLLIQR